MLICKISINKCFCMWFLWVKIKIFWNYLLNKEFKWIKKIINKEFFYIGKNVIEYLFIFCF